MTVTPKGVRMINENVVQPGRGFIVTDMDSVSWDQIPDGSLYVNPNNGIMQVKLYGETQWVPTNIKNDGTLSIARDTSVRMETFTLTLLDDGEGYFYCIDGNGRQRRMIKQEDGFVFELEGKYIPGRNHLQVVFDDVLERSEQSGGVIEIDSKRFKVTENIPEGTEVTARYIQWVKLGNPYPRIYERPGDPDPYAENGDLWLDVTEDDDDLNDVISVNLVPWSRVINKPYTLEGYGLREEVDTNFARISHAHTTADIENFGVRVREEQSYNAQTVKNIDIDVNKRGGSAAANKIAVYDSTGKIPTAALPAVFTVGMIIDWYGDSGNVPAGWAICNGQVANGRQTPDLRGKFVIGANQNYSSGDMATQFRCKGDYGALNFTSEPKKIGAKNIPKHRHDKGTYVIKGGAFSGAGSSTNGDTGERPKYVAPFYKISTGTNGVPVDHDGSKGDYVGFDTSKSSSCWSGYSGYAGGNDSGETEAFTVTIKNVIPRCVALWKIMYVGV